MINLPVIRATALAAPDGSEVAREAKELRRSFRLAFSGMSAKGEESAVVTCGCHIPVKLGPVTIISKKPMPRDKEIGGAEESKDPE